MIISFTLSKRAIPKVEPIKQVTEVQAVDFCCQVNDKIELVPSTPADTESVSALNEMLKSGHVKETPKV